MAALTGDDLVTAAYGQLVSEDPSADALGGFPSPTDDPGPHLSYAIQWILFAVMGFGFIGYVIRTEIVKAKEDAGERPVRVKKRRDRDADDEDALLDAQLERRSGRTRSGQLDEVLIVLAPDVFDAIGQDEHAFRVE